MVRNGFVEIKTLPTKLFNSFLVLPMLLVIVGTVSCSDKKEKAGECRRIHNVKCLSDLYLEARAQGDDGGMLFLMKTIRETGGADSEKELLELYGSGNQVEKKRILAELVDMKSRLAVPELIKNLLNTLQTGGDGSGEVEIIERLEPGAIERELNIMLAKSESARQDKSLFAAEQYLENAGALAKLVNGNNLAAAQSANESLKKERRIAGTAESVIEALQDGRLSEAYTSSNIFYEQTGSERVKALLPELKTLSALEEKFYRVASDQENARNKYLKAKSDKVGQAELIRLKASFDTEKGNMVIARRNLERARQKLPVLTDKMRNALGQEEKD